MENGEIWSLSSKFINLSSPNFVHLTVLMMSTDKQNFIPIASGGSSLCVHKLPVYSAIFLFCPMSEVTSQ